MFKVAILGCENSHASTFINDVLNGKLVDDVEFVGVYSDNMEAAKKLQEKYGVPATDSYDAFVGKVDGIIITARHGDNHYKFAKPYIASGIPLFIDKPITCTEEDAKAFMDELKAHNVPVTGGSVCVLSDYVQELKKAVQEGTYGKVLGGFVRAPFLSDEQNGGFYFSAQHLVSVMMEIFGNYPKSVQTVQNGDTITGIVRYEDFDVSISYVTRNYIYYAGISCEKNVIGAEYKVDKFKEEFLLFHELLHGKSQRQSYEDFFAPVYIMNAIEKSLQTGKEEPIRYFHD